MTNKYEIEKVTYGDGSVTYFVLKNGKKANSIIGTPFKYSTLEEARVLVESLRGREARETVVTREIVE